MTPKELADQIREVHRICQEWEDKPASDAFHRPKWTRWFDMLASILLMGFALGIALLVGQLSIKTVLVAHALVVVVWALTAASILYGAVSACVAAVFALREWNDFALPFSPSDAKNLDDLIAFEDRLAACDRKVLDTVVLWLETRAKMLENGRLFLVGMATMAGAVVGGLLWPEGAIHAYLESSIPEAWKMILQILPLSLLVGGILGIMGAWKCGTACQNRALMIRRAMSKTIPAGSTSSFKKEDSP